MSFWQDLFSNEKGQERTRKFNQGLFDTLEYYLGPTGIPERLNALGMLNPVQDMYEAGADMKAGDYGSAAVNTASALMPTIGAKLAGGGAVDDVANVISDTLTSVGTKATGAMDAGRGFAADEFGGVGPKGIRAYHGSPHDFDKFSMDAIGTGEGAQAYGHGLYFAENEGVARGYRDALAKVPNTPEGNVWDLMTNYGMSPDEVESHLEDAVSYAATESTRAKAKASLDALRSGAWKSAQGQGRMYEVNINANADDFLDWDAPLSEQSAGVQRLAQSAGIADAVPEWRFNGYDGGYFRKTETGNLKIGEVRHLGGDEYRARVGRDEIGVFSSPDKARAAIDRVLVDRGGASGALQMRGSDVYDRLSGGRDSLVHSAPSRAEATAQMQNAGIPGIKYLDRGSRGAGDGTRNYVVFDENLIEIVRKYGIAGAAAMLGVSASDVQAAIDGNQLPSIFSENR